MNYRLVCGVATLTLALGGCLDDNPFYIDPTGETSSTSEDPTTTVGESSTGAATTEEPTSATGSTGPATTGGSSTTGLSTGSSTSDTDDTDDTADDTGGSSTTMPPGICGDGNLDPGELCDDGNQDDTDECTVVCLPPPQLDLNKVLFPELTGIVGSEGNNSKPGLCPNALVGMGISGYIEIGVLRAKLACQSFNIVSIGNGEFEVQRLGEESYGPYAGNMDDPDLIKGVICPDEAPFMRGLNGWFGEPEMTKIEVQCSKLRIVPVEDSYIVVPLDAESVTAGYNGWGDMGTAVTCDDYPGSIAVDVVIHTTEYGVSGLQLRCAEPSFL